MSIGYNENASLFMFFEKLQSNLVCWNVEIGL